jgi:hypothetical protein
MKDTHTPCGMLSDFFRRLAISPMVDIVYLQFLERLHRLLQQSAWNPDTCRHSCLLRYFLPLHVTLYIVRDVEEKRVRSAIVPNVLGVQ